MSDELPFRIVIISVIGLGLVSGLVNCSRGPSHPMETRSSTLMGGTNDRGYDEVEQQLLQTMSEARKLGPANPLLLSTMYSLASFYREHEAYDQAEQIYQEALALKEQISGPTHQDIAIILHHYAALLRDARREKEATALEHRARQIQSFHNHKHAPAPGL